ncbi:MAG: cell division protein SepF [Methanobacteriota archaeon]
MGLLRRFVGEESRTKNDLAGDFIDLSDGVDAAGAPTASWIRVAELTKYDDLRGYLSTVYEGNTLVLDIAGVKGDEIAMRRVTSDLKKLASDVGGDVAGLGDHMLLVTPTGMKVDRRKLRSGA